MAGHFCGLERIDGNHFDFGPGSVLEPTMLRPLSFFCTIIALSGAAQSQNPFSPPRATFQYAPDRTCDLTNLDVDLEVDYSQKTIVGVTVNTLKPLRNSIRSVVLHAGKGLEIRSVKVNGSAATFERKETELHIQTLPLVKGKEFKVTIEYTAANSRGTGFGSGGGGWHWILPTKDKPERVGFWTQGETKYNSEWAPTWDYPNDLTTSQVKCTVQSDWDVIGNGKLVSTELSKDKTKKTWTWRMDQPHATYLLSIYGGPFDIQKDKWNGVDLWYVVPRGLGYLIKDSFGNTKDMLGYFSDVLGVKYPWPKYAQNAMYDFGGGMENVSSTILGEGGLTESRDGYFTMDSLNSHELAHQWFGDLVTCKDWGDTWLNESFATFMQFLYFEHSRGSDSYAQEVDDGMRSYFQEARRYKRPLSTKLYSDPDGMFDSHSYPKGGVILHTLRRFLGDEAFFAGLNAYLTKWRHTPVESSQLRRSMTEATGINCEPFWAQWVEKPGHPVLEYSWTYGQGSVQLTIKQTQDTKDGTPIYDTACKVGLFDGQKMERRTLRMSKVEETFSLPLSSKPIAVVLDPDHDFLREIPRITWTVEEAVAIVAHAPNPSDRAAAMRVLVANPTEPNIRQLTEVLKRDTGRSPAFEQTSGLANLARPELRDFWMAETKHANFSRRAQAVLALGKLVPDETTIAAVRGLVTEAAPIQVVINALNVLKSWDAKGNAPIFEKAKSIPDRRGRIKRAAENALGN